MKEKDFQSKFNRWLELCWNADVSARFELKFIDLSKKKRLNFKSDIKEHQIRSLSAHRHIFKIPDCGYQNPYDCYHISGRGYLVVQFWKPREKNFYIIDIREIKRLIKSGVKSINEDDCHKIGIKHWFQ